MNKPDLFLSPFRAPTYPRASTSPCVVRAAPSTNTFPGLFQPGARIPTLHSRAACPQTWQPAASIFDAGPLRSQWMELELELEMQTTRLADSRFLAFDEPA